MYLQTERIRDMNAQLFGTKTCTMCIFFQRCGRSTFTMFTLVTWWWATDRLLDSYWHVFFFIWSLSRFLQPLLFSESRLFSQPNTHCVFQKWHWWMNSGGDRIELDFEPRSPKFRAGNMNIKLCGIFDPDDFWFSITLISFNMSDCKSSHSFIWYMI